MKIITTLTGSATEADWTEPRGILRTVHDEPQPGFFRRITLGGAGIVVSRGEHAVGIPLAVLLALAEQIEPALVPIAGPSVSASRPTIAQLAQQAIAKSEPEAPNAEAATNQ